MTFSGNDQKMMINYIKQLYFSGNDNKNNMIKHQEMINQNVHKMIK